MARIFKTALDGGYGRAIEAGFAFLGDSAKIGLSDRVVIKPNLTFPTFQPGVMTNPEAIEAVILYLKNFTSHISLCESDSGGYNRFSMDEVFRVTGISEIAKRYGVKLVNLSFESSRNITVATRRSEIEVPVPILLLDETDRFITMPVPKVHANTIISVAIKNQWGVIQIPADRLKLHPVFKYVVHAVNKAMPNPIVIVDGRFGLTRNGPMRGDVVDLNWLLMADNLFANDVVVSQLMGFDPLKIPYLRYAMNLEGIRPDDRHVTNELLIAETTKFFLSRQWTDYPGLITFKSRPLAYLGYESRLAKPLHKLLYLFREPFY